MATTVPTTGVAGLTSLTYYPTPRVEYGRAGSGVATVAIVSGGTGYTGTTGKTSTAESGYSGSGATFTISHTGGVIDAISAVTAAGDGYRVGDYLTVDGGNGDCVLRVDAVTAFDGD
jgi:hypothetical protein